MTTVVARTVPESRARHLDAVRGSMRDSSKVDSRFDDAGDCGS
jgi:hypothetical protein